MWDRLTECVLGAWCAGNSAAVKRERMAIDEVRGLLAEVLEEEGE